MQSHQTQQDSDNDTVPQNRYNKWPYYIPPDYWLMNSDASSLHWTNFSPPDDWMALHEELFSQQTGQPGSEMIHRLVEKDPISSPVVDPFPPGGSSLFNNPSTIYSYAEIPSIYPPPSPCFAQIPSAGRRDWKFLLYRYAQYATGALFSDCMMDGGGAYVIVNVRI